MPLLVENINVSYSITIKMKTTKIQWEYLLSLLYADDTSILVSGTNIDEIQERSKLMLNSLSQWFKCNGLTLNSRKTKVLKFETINQDNMPVH
jgi:hypothetical protein